MKKKTSKTGDALRQVFPNRQAEIAEYENARSKFQSGSTLHKQALQNVSAKFEVYVSNKFDKVQGELKKLDTKCHLDDTDGIQHYEEVKKSLKILYALKKHFK